MFPVNMRSFPSCGGVTGRAEVLVTAGNRLGKQNQSLKSKIKNMMGDEEIMYYVVDVTREEERGGESSVNLI